MGTNTRIIGIFINWKHQKKITLREWHNMWVTQLILWGPWRPGVKLGQKLSQKFVLSIQTSFNLVNIFLKKINVNIGNQTFMYKTWVINILNNTVFCCDFFIMYKSIYQTFFLTARNCFKLETTFRVESDIFIDLS